MINHLRYNGFQVTVKTMLQRARNFLNQSNPYAANVQCTPKRIYKMIFEFTNQYSQDWKDCIQNYFERVYRA